MDNITLDILKSFEYYLSRYPRNPRIDANCGICTNWVIFLDMIDSDLETWPTLFSKFYESWPLYTGYKDYPVPHPDFSDHEIAYDIAHDCWVGEYGERRMQLISHIISCVEKEIK